MKGEARLCTLLRLCTTERFVTPHKARRLAFPVVVVFGAIINLKSAKLVPCLSLSRALLENGRQRCRGKEKSLWEGKRHPEKRAKKTLGVKTFHPGPKKQPQP